MIHQPPIIVAEEGKVLPPLVPKSLYKIVSEHKDVTKVSMCLFSTWLNFWIKAVYNICELLNLHSFTSIAGANVCNCKVHALLETSHFPRLPRRSKEYCIEVYLHYVHSAYG